MLADQVENRINGQLSDGIEVDASIKAVIEFIEIHFPEFSEKVKGDITASEKAITDKLCKHFNRQAGSYPFHFHHENVEDHHSGKSPQTDIGTMSRAEQIIVEDRVYGEWDSYFSIEAKRLPTLGHNREKEYVIGHDKPNGGIERFKKGIHGRNLKYAAIIAYVQNKDFDYWYLQINDWIEELIKTSAGEWINEDKLIKSRTHPAMNLAKFESDNVRLPITAKPQKTRLFHFWVSLVDKTMVN